MQDPKIWVGTSPSNIFWSSDSKTVYFSWNPDKNPVDSLYKITLDSTEPQKVSLEEKGTLAIQEEVLSPDFSKRLFVVNNDLFIQDLKTFESKPLTATLSSKRNIGFNSDGKIAFFGQGDNIYTVDLNSGLIKQLTNFVNKAEKKKPNNNEADKALKKDQLELFEVLREEKENKDASKKYKELLQEKTPREISYSGSNLTRVSISPDLKFVFYNLIKQSDRERTIVPNYVTDSGYTEDIPARSKVGQPKDNQESYIFDIERDSVYKINSDVLPGLNRYPEYFNDYKKDSLTLASWKKSIQVYGPVFSPNSKHTVVVVKSEDNKDRWIMELESETGNLKLVDHQYDEAWIGGPGIGWGLGTLGFLDDNILYFQSEKSGYSHLYSFDFSTGKTSQLTSGDFEVKEVKLSKDKQWFFMTTNEVHPGETHFYKMAVNGGKRIKLTQMEGGNEVILSPDEKYMAIKYSNSNTPWELYLQPTDISSSATKITSSTTAGFQAYTWRKPEIIKVKARDGEEVYARLYQPTKKEKNGKAVIFVHGAGYLQNAHKWWSSYFREYMFHNLLVDKGYTVLDMDYRASAGYGRDVRTGIYRYMGGKDLTDNVDGAKLLASKYGINPKEIGIYGGSYGGFITLMAMFTTPDIFAVGAALRPVTDWAAYNQGYTSNILNEPQDDPIAYRRSSPIFHADGLKGKLLICHGQVDVNVHIQDSYRLAQKLIELKKENWEMASYPVEDHGFIQPTSWMDEYKRILKLFEEM